MTNAQKLARDLALDVLKAYNAKIFQSVATPEQRERAQAAAYIIAESHIRRIAVDAIEQSEEYSMSNLNAWLSEKVDES